MMVPDYKQRPVSRTDQARLGLTSTLGQCVGCHQMDLGVNLSLSNYLGMRPEKRGKGGKMREGQGDGWGRGREGEGQGEKEREGGREEGREGERAYGLALTFTKFLGASIPYNLCSSISYIQYCTYDIVQYEYVRYCKVSDGFTSSNLITLKLYTISYQSS